MPFLSKRFGAHENVLLLLWNYHISYYQEPSFINVYKEYEGLLPSWLYAFKFQNASIWAADWTVVSNTKLKF